MSNHSMNLDEFISTVFTDLDENNNICLAQPKTNAGFRHFKVSPKKISQIQRKPAEWYVCVSTVKKGDDLGLRRRKEDCVSAHAIMLDDVGTKANVPPVDPNIKLETSKGNFQYVYVIEPFDVSTPEGVAYYEACQRGLANEGYADAGALEVNRVMRIPGSVNTKEGRDNWQTKATAVDVGGFWPLDELMQAMDAKPDYEGVKSTAQVQYNGNVPDNVKDRLADYLQEQGMLGHYDGAFYTIPCPWAHEHTSGDGTAGYSPLGCGSMPLTRGFNCFHEHCKKRNIKDYVEYIAYQDGAPSVTTSGTGELEAAYIQEKMEPLNAGDRYTVLIEGLDACHAAFLPNRKGKQENPSVAQLTTRRNVQYIVDTARVKLRMDMQSRSMSAHFIDESRQLLISRRDDALRVLTDVAQGVGMSALKEMHAIFEEISQNARFHPFEEYLNGLEWDGMDRLSDLTASVRVREGYEEIWPIYLRKWLIQCVQAARGWSNPQMMRNVLVLQGDQSIGKTTWLSKLVDTAYFKEGVQLALHGHSAKDSIIAATGYVIVELGELDSTFSKSESGALKAFLSMSTDAYRTPYGRYPDEWPRCTSYCASVNRLDFLIDETGSSRFWPVEVESIDWNLDIDMNQVWAQVDALHKAGEKWDLKVDHMNIQKAQSERFRMMDACEERLINWLATHNDDEWEPLTASDIARDVIEVSTSRVNLSTIRRVMDAEVGKRRRQIKGIRNAWKFPRKIKMPVSSD